MWIDIEYLLLSKKKIQILIKILCSIINAKYTNFCLKLNNIFTSDFSLIKYTQDD